MSKTTNNTQRVTFGKIEYFAASATRAIIFDGHIVGEIVKGGEGCGYDVVLFVDAGRDNASDRSHNRCFEMAFDGIRYEHWSIALNAAKEYAIATLLDAEIVRTHERSGGRGVTGWIKITQEPAQAETVEAEEPAQAETVEVEIPAFKGAVVVPVMANGEKVGHITQVQNEIYAGVAGYRVTVGETQGVFFKTARAAKAAAKEMAIAHCAQVETVEVEEPAQPMANEDGESVSLECPACDRVVATVTPANVGPSSYTRTCKCGRRTRHDVTLTITQDDRIRVARWGMVATNVGTLKRHWVQTDRGMKWGKVFVPAEAYA